MEYSEQGFSLREVVFLFLLVLVSVLLVVRIIKLFGSKD
jgi:competence protein ComGC